MHIWQLMQTYANLVLEPNEFYRMKETTYMTRIL